jgi:protein SCO1
MTPKHPRRTLLLGAAAWFCTLATGETLAPAKAGTRAASDTVALPPNSVYRLEVTLTDQDGQSNRWFDAQAQHPGPRIVGMFYSYCDMVCPMLFETVKIIESRLSEAARNRLRVDMISFDPVRDDVATLKKTAAQRAGDERRWRLYRPQPADVRKVAGVLGVQYRRLSNGEFNHSTPMILLDAQGVEIMRSETIGQPAPAFVKAVERALSV